VTTTKSLMSNLHVHSYLVTYPPNEILVPGSLPRKCFVFQLSYRLQRLCHHFIYKNWHSSLFLFFSMWD